MLVETIFVEDLKLCNKGKRLREIEFKFIRLVRNEHSQKANHLNLVGLFLRFFTVGVVRVLRLVHHFLVQFDNQVIQVVIHVDMVTMMRITGRYGLASDRTPISSRISGKYHYVSGARIDLVQSVQKLLEFRQAGIQSRGFVLGGSGAFRVIVQPDVEFEEVSSNFVLPHTSSSFGANGKGGSVPFR